MSLKMKFITYEIIIHVTVDELHRTTHYSKVILNPGVLADGYMSVGGTAYECV